LFLDDIAVLKPTVFISVPRIYNKTMTSVKMKIKKAGSIVGALFKVAFNNKLSAL
jgi:long-chain acyl-CoA synthetase